MSVRALVDKLETERRLDDYEYKRLLCEDERELGYLTERACAVRDKIFGKSVYGRGLIELTNFCKNDCYYCGIRKSNAKIERYRLSDGQILACCGQGYALGLRTFVLQGGEDGFYTDERLSSLIKAIKTSWPDCAVTLSLGERSRESYRALYEAGADRYLLRHETADGGHYAKLHPPVLKLENRLNCLRQLKEIGYQTGCGFMAGSPFQSGDDIVRDLSFIHDFQPQMVGIGPFIPHRDTPFAAYPAGGLTLTLRLLSIVRLMLPSVLLPATTALGTIHPNGREMGILAGANVVMPNLSPAGVREKYSLYDNKISAGAETAEGYNSLKAKISGIGYELVSSRGDYGF